MGSLLVTGFGPFGEHSENPSALLVKSLRDYDTRVIRVSYGAAERFVKRGIPNGVDRLLMLGVGRECDRFRVERKARNFVGDTPDVAGDARGPGRIDPNSPPFLWSTMFAGWVHPTPSWRPSAKAGSYLCNYLYFLALRRRPDILSGFVHVPPLAVMPIERQQALLERILWRVERES
jgi:pyroglutamyl-peptidase